MDQHPEPPRHAAATGRPTVWSGRCARLCRLSSVSSFPGWSMHALRLCRRGTSAVASSFASAHGGECLRTAGSLL